MTRLLAPVVVAAVVAFGGPAGPAPVAAQNPPLLEVGAVAPDFALTGSTRYGVLQRPVRLGDYRGKTVVLAFFYRVRTPG